MAKMKLRSVFWVVSTHVLTTGFAMPFVSGIVATLVLMATQPSEVVAFLILLTIQATGYVGGVFYSLSYIRKVALIKGPLACVKPSIIIFVVPAIMGFAVNVASLFADQQGINPTVGTIAYVFFYTVICYAFAKITHAGFSRMEPHPA